MSKCHPQCKQISAKEEFEKWLRSHPEDVETLSMLNDPSYKDIYFVKHHRDCPHMKEAIKRGKELAKRHGW